MDEEVRKRLLEAMDGMINTAGQIKDFTVEQAPLVIQDYIRWGVVQGVCTILLGVALLILAAGLRSVAKKSEKDSEIRYFLSCLALVALLASMLPFSFGALRASKAYFAPRAYIIDEIREAVKPSPTYK